jgi:DNA polymerase-3 subunit delta
VKVRTATDLARAPLDDVRLFLLFGPDQAGAAEIARGLEARLGGERLELDARTLEADPSRLASEAAAVAMFGDRALLSVRGAGDALADAAGLLLDAPAAGNPAVVVAGDLPAASRLRKLADGHPLARALACYPPSDSDLAALAERHATALGLRLGPGVAARLGERAGGERGVLAREVEKLADFANATPARPARLDLDQLGQVVAGDGGADLDPLLDAVTLGQPAEVARQLDRLAAEGQDGITLLRAAARRFSLIAEARAGMDAGQSAETAVKALRPFWKLERPLAEATRQWPAERIALARARLLATERAIRAPSSAGPRLAAWLLLALARAAAGAAPRRRAAPTGRD